MGDFAAVGRPYQPYRSRANVFSPAQCRRIVELGTSLPEEDGTLSDGARSDSLRRSRTAWITSGPSTAWIHERLSRVVESANRWYRFELDGLEEDLQFSTYDDPGAHYTWHQDGLDGPVDRRKLTVVVQLSEPQAHRGADLELFTIASDVAAVRDDFLTRTSRLGTAVVFPGFEMHRVTPLVDGVRHSLVAWVSGPPFR